MQVCFSRGMCFPLLNSRILSDFFLGIVEQICLNLVYTITPRTVSCDMSRNIHTQGPDSEEQLVAMLATLRVTATEEADFESRFLCEFHERVAREAVCCPARRHLFAHLLQMMDNLGRGRLAFGASAMGLGVLAIGYAMYPAGTVGTDTTASVASESHTSPLVLPVLSDDLVEYTTVRVEPARSTFEVGGVTITRGQHSTVIEVPNTTVISVPQRQGNYTQLPATSVRYAF